MASGVAYEVIGVPGNAKVVHLGSAANPSIIFGDPNALGGLNDGLHGVSGGGVGVSVNGTGVWAATANGAGYATGAGGTVTQATSITTAVTLNKAVGEVVTVSAATAAGAEDTFTVNNSLVGANDLVVVHLKSTSSAGTPMCFCSAVAAGSFNITITNLHAATALNNTLTIGFAVVKGVVA